MMRTGGLNWNRRSEEQDVRVEQVEQQILLT